MFCIFVSIILHPMANKLMYEHLSIYSGSPIIARNYNYRKFTYPWHVHKEFEIIYVKESTGERFVADSVESFGANDVTLVGHGVPHYMKSDEEYENDKEHRRVSGTIIQFEEEFMSHAINNYADLAHIKKLLDESRRGINFPYPANKEIINCIEQLPQSKGFMRIINLLHLLDLMAGFESKRYLGSVRFCNTMSMTMDQRMEKTLAYISEHFKEDIDLDKVASLAAMNSSSFSRYFKEKTGKTFTEYMLSLRIGFACKLLIEDIIDISQVSLECGFNTIAHFNRVFKRHTGLTPTDYRKEFLK